jgi:type IV secretory pathway TrbD component
MANNAYPDAYGRIDESEFHIAPVSMRKETSPMTLYFRSVQARAIRNLRSKVADKFLVLVAGLLASAVIGSRQGWEKFDWSHAVLTFVIWFVGFALYHYLRAQWEIHNELQQKLELSYMNREDYAHLQACQTLFKSACRLKQSLGACRAERPLLDPEGREFRRQYEDYLVLTTEVYLTVVPHPIHPLPVDPSSNIPAKDLALAMTHHVEWLRDHQAALQATISERDRS